ncbi:hypothetical protein LRS07_11710 [Aquabacterium sp. J223]|nr:hypothetical protein [Aquabacterium sp. J223]UUX94018.1 hypothetical protein LRS07_11710 [Aquabacterium sp. J223]
MTLAPLVSVLLFLAAIVSAFWYLRNEEVERETESVKRDTEVAQQQIRLRLADNQELVLRLARDLRAGDATTDGFEKGAPALSRQRLELTHLSWVDAEGRLRASAIGPVVLVQHDGLGVSSPADPRNGPPPKPSAPCASSASRPTPRPSSTTAGCWCSSCRCRWWRTGSSPARSSPSTRWRRCCATSCRWS